MLTKLLTCYLAPYKWWLTWVMVLQFVASMAALFLPNLNARIIDQGVAKGDTAFILRFGTIMLIVSLAQVACLGAAVFIGAKAAMSFGRDVRGKLFDCVLSFSSQEVARFGAPSLITRNTNDVQQVQMLVMLASTTIAGAPMMMIGGIIMALREDVKMSWLILLAMIVLGSIFGFVAFRVPPLFRLNQTRLDNLNRVLREQISGIRVIRAFNREQVEQERFASANTKIREVSIRIGLMFILLHPLANLVINLANVGIIWFGSFRVDNSKIMVGQLIAFMTYLVQILISVTMAMAMLFFIPRAQVCAQRIMEVLNTSSKVVTAQNPVTSLRGLGRVRFENVSFAYPGAEEPVLHNISFELTPGTTTAIIGSTGSGKTTLVNLVPRLYDASGGAVLVDGVNVCELEPETLWNRIGFVPQQPYLFSGTVASNLRYGTPEATDEQMWEALRWAQVEDFVREIGGLDAKITQGGTNVSGGQRQRLSIARALIRRPDIYLFDDAFSALDMATDSRLRAVLSEKTGTATSLIVAQRVSSIRQADQIIVLEAGRIVGKGTHLELMDTCATYQEIVDSQLNAQEAA